jgi:uncharacterized protein
MPRLNVAKIKKMTGKTVPFKQNVQMPPFNAQGERVHFSGPVYIDVVIDDTGKHLVVEGRVSGKLKLACSRCLDFFDYSIEVPIKEVYTDAPEEDAGEANSFTGDFLDLAPEITKSIIMHLPMKALCRRECQGLCPVCGINLNEGQCRCTEIDFDPRLAVLKKYFAPE